jgi:HD superfamily phosphodiesterase
MERSIYLGTMEGCSQEEIELLIIASLFHDTGFIIQYDNNELFGAKIAKNYLRTMLYPEDKIKIIESLILITDPQKTPSNLLEEIIKDADMDNIGTKEFFDANEKMKHELETIKQIKIKDPDWKHASLSLIEGYKFYTTTQEKERNDMLQKNIDALKKGLSK